MTITIIIILTLIVIIIYRDENMLTSVKIYCNFNEYIYTRLDSCKEIIMKSKYKPVSNEVVLFIRSSYTQAM